MLCTFLYVLRLGAVVALHLDDGGHADGVDLVGLLPSLGHISSPPPVAALSVGTPHLQFSINWVNMLLPKTIICVPAGRCLGRR